jgi:glycosyltransferase involved in cell wall biosynthesis/beta-glucosidase/6-phospho-beta-glucosidase/beta-galactosidase
VDDHRSLLPGPRHLARIPFIGAFESTFLPGHGVDVAETTQHTSHWRADLDADLDAGVRRFRYPLRWHRIEAERGRYDWTDTDAVLGHLQHRGAEPIVDLVHHTSYPQWLVDGFRDPGFGPAYLRFVEAVASRYPWLTAYTAFNEPFATLFLSGHEALWPPYDRGAAGFTRLATNVLPAVSAAAQCLRALLPDARHLWVDTCEHHRGTAGGPAAHAAMANDRRFVLLDLALGRSLDLERPFLRSVVEAGGESLLDLPPVRVDLLGLDYYSHSEWWYDDRGAHSPSPHPLGFAAVAAQYAERYEVPMILAETNVRGMPSDRASWFRHMLEEYHRAVADGIRLEGFCWFPSVDSCDWDSLLARPGGRTDPVGVTSIAVGGTRTRTCFTDVWEAAVGGAPPARLPAYRFQEPCDEQLAGVVARLGHWEWEDPPPEETSPAIPVPIDRRAAMAAQPKDPTTMNDLVVLSHLRWVWVWQRPQHLVSRFAAHRTRAGARTWFVEEPAFGDVAAPELATEPAGGGVTRVWLVLPRDLDRGGHPGFDVAGSQDYGPLLRELLAQHGVAGPDVLLYTPMALDVAEELSPARLFYDVMDDLASFKSAPEGLVLRHRRVLSEAAVVFAGGRSLHRSVAQHRTGPCLLFPSGVETSHFAASRALRSEHSRPVAGYVGVIDERVDLDLVAELAGALPDWTIRMVGPVAKIDEEDLPHAVNIEYAGMAAYERLPAIMAELDVALMPFALNEATRSISPTKTLEYLAAGLPVVSTRVPDVVADYEGVVSLVDGAAAFADACRAALHECTEQRDRGARVLARRHEWDTIAQQMTVAMATAATAYEISGAPA